MQTKKYEGFGINDSKYIILKTSEKDYVAIIPKDMYGMHEEIVSLLKKMLKAAKNIDLPGDDQRISGGFVRMLNRFKVEGRSEKYGEGPHGKVRALLQEAILSNIDTLLNVCREKGFKDLEAVLVNIAKGENGG